MPAVKMNLFFNVVVELDDYKLRLRAKKHLKNYVMSTKKGADLPSKALYKLPLVIIPLASNPIK